MKTEILLGIYYLVVLKVRFSGVIFELVPEDNYYSSLHANSLE